MYTLNAEKTEINILFLKIRTDMARISSDTYEKYEQETSKTRKLLVPGHYCTLPPKKLHLTCRCSSNGPGLYLTCKEECCLPRFTIANYAVCELILAQEALPTRSSTLTLQLNEQHALY